jgi:hypothetical protein
MRICSLMLALLPALTVPLAPAAQAGEGLEVYRAETIDYVFPATFKPAGQPSEPVRMAAARSGIHAAQLVAVSPGPIKGLKAAVGDLKGPGTIPGSAWKVAYGVADGVPAKAGEIGFFDSLESEPPAEVAPGKSGQAVQSIWLKLYVPADAKPGDYAGKVTVKAEGGSAEVPVNVKVFDWVMPDPKTWHAHFDAIQSPESVAMAYDVELWSDKHLALLDKTFAILGEMGQKTLYITVVRRTHYGNENAVVRWTKDDKDQLQPDFTNVEKYLDVAVKHLGKIPGVIFYCWEPVESMGHAGGAGTAGRTTDRPMQYTLWDPKTGEQKKRTGPAWGSAESKDLWKRFNTGLKPVLEKRGLTDGMLFGLIGDARPTKQAMDDIVTGADKPRWAVHSHFYCPEWQGHKIGMAIALWGIHLNICDPKQGRGFGWNTDFWLAYYPREFKMDAPLVEHRFKMEMWTGALSLYELGQSGKSRFACGLGRIGCDFWKVVKDERGRVRATLAGYYPESYWGQLNLNYCISSILGKGKNGALPTIRSEAFREGSQDVEVRTFVEKAIELKPFREKLGEEMATKLRELLDERIRMANRGGGARDDQKTGKLDDVKIDLLGSNTKLYGAAEEVAKKLGTMYIAESAGELFDMPKKVKK